MLELQSNCIKYLYSGFDDANPEILDYGRVDFPTGNWSDLFLSFSEKMADIISRKLPHFQQLETFLIPPPEMVIKVQARSPEFDEESKDEWMRWELTQTLLPENQGYAIKFDLPITKNVKDLDQSSGLALRNRHLNRINGLLRRNALFLSGVFLPHSIWHEIIEYLAPSESLSSLLIKENNFYLHIYYEKNKVPRIRWYGNNMDSKGQSNDSFEKMLENLSIELMANNHQTGGKVFVFRDNFEHNEISQLEDRIKADLKIVPENQMLPETSNGNVEYLLLSRAHKKIGKLFMCKQI